jgi:DNA-binding FrmR family transcriptional regulator
MTEPENLTLRLLHSIDGKLDGVYDDVKDIKVRMTSVEEALAGVNRRIDRAEGHLDRIERRLELVDR